MSVSVPITVLTGVAAAALLGTELLTEAAWSARLNVAWTNRILAGLGVSGRLMAGATITLIAHGLISSP